MNRRMVIGFLPAAVLAACSAPPPEKYRLVPVPGTPENGFAGKLSVRSIGIPDDLNQDAIARPSTMYQFDSFSGAVWAAPLAAMLQTVMVQNLAQRLPAATIIESGGAIGAPLETFVEINILGFEPDPSGVVTLQAQFAIRDGDAAGYMTRGITLNANPAALDPADIVAAMSTLWGQAADHIAANFGG